MVVLQEFIVVVDGYEKENKIKLHHRKNLEKSNKNSHKISLTH